MTTKIKLILILLCSGLLTGITFAGQTYRIDNPSDTLAISIANKGLTQIAIQQSRIRTINHDSTALDIQTDETSGIIFIQPQSTSSFNLYLTSEDDVTYHLYLTPIEQASQAILIDSTIVSQKIAEHWEKQNPFTQTITHLMQHLARAEPPPGYAIINPGKVHLSSDLAITLKALYSYQGQYLRGDVISLINTSDSSVTLSATQFHQQGVIASSLSNRHLAPCEKTQLYLIYQRGANNGR